MHIKTLLVTYTHTFISTPGDTIVCIRNATTNVKYGNILKIYGITYVYYFTRV